MVVFRSLPPSLNVLYITDTTATNTTTTNNEAQTFKTSYSTSNGTATAGKVTIASATEMSTAAEGSYGGIVSVSLTCPDWINSALKVLSPGGYLVLHVPAEANASRALLFAGATDIATTDVPSSPFVEVCGRRAPWSGAAAVPLALKRKTPAAVPTTTTPTTTTTSTSTTPAKSVWTIDDDDLAEADVVDQDSLLAKEEFKVEVIRPSVAVGKGGCAPTRKACKNCTCGRKEREQEGGAPAPVAATPTVMVSACGNCGLGDAFRCSGCPFLGKPPFKSGDVVKLDV
jgi:hypothetical protein